MLDRRLQIYLNLRRRGVEVPSKKSNRIDTNMAGWPGRDLRNTYELMGNAFRRPWSESHLIQLSFLK